MCDRCIPMPGCVHGGCHDKAFGCDCDKDKEDGTALWTGARCDCRELSSAFAHWEFIHLWLKVFIRCQPYHASSFIGQAMAQQK